MKFISVVLSLCGLVFFAGACEKKKAEPVKAEAAAGKNQVKAVIGAAGGELSFPSGGARLEIPAGLLQEELSITFKRVKPSFDLAGRDFVGQAYRISPRVTFAPGAAKLFVPVDRELPGLPADIKLRMFYYDKLVSEGGPAGPSFVHEWQPQALVKFQGYSQDQKHLVFWVYETFSDRTTKAPFGLLQAGFDLP